MAKITAARRKKLPASKFAIPPDGYPIDTRARAANALARSSGKPEAARVKRAVCAAYPDFPECQSTPDGRKSSASARRAAGRRAA